ncbi:MAG TPA: glycoside hydrolase domain-containing protein [Anaerolineales bacterium]|nr:glycoside hydrolase domain-containing protein [Anaerolineales bacterium]
MRIYKYKITLQGLIAACLLLSGLLVSQASPALSGLTPPPPVGTAEPEEALQPIDGRPASTSETFQLFFPFIFGAGGAQTIQIDAAWLEGMDGNWKTNFLPGDQVRLNVSGNAQHNVTIGLRWTLDGPCGVTEVFNETVNLTVGAWSHSTTTAAPACPGFYITTVETTYLLETDRLDTLLTVNPPSDVITMVYPRQGFDRCYLPSIGQMQTWWTNSPYWVFNIYLGGSMFFCQDDVPDEVWVHQAAEQGWSFILTWVGPQAPCSNFRIKMSSNASTAYQQGRNEAGAAFNAARAMGFLGDMVLYYDMEGYGSTASSSCRSAVDSFMLGWAERLHQLGVKAGGYGSPASSHIADWANNSHAPDDIWLAHWVYYCNNNTTFCYNPEATVWSHYLSNSLWADHKRLRQYTGGHSETWGGVPLVIDSNALDGEVTTIPGLATTAVEGALEAVQLSTTPQIQFMHLLSAQDGWVVRDGRLLFTDDGGGSWRDLTPSETGSGAISAVEFLDAQRIWLARVPSQTEAFAEIEILYSLDGGLSWESSLLPLAGGFSDQPIARAYLDFSDSQNGFLALKLQSGSSFSLGRLFATADGGQTWEERSLPLGEPVAFLDAERGWTAGGPGGDQLYRTLDGGRTWQPQQLEVLAAELDGGQVFIGLPQFDQRGAGYLPVTVAKTGAASYLVLHSEDQGSSWLVAHKIEIDHASAPGLGLPFSLASDGTWWANTSEGLVASAANQPAPQRLSAAGLPQGVVTLDMDASQNGWALVQQGNCYGEKTPLGQSGSSVGQPFRCEQVMRLLMTSDGGQTWQEVFFR